MIYLFNSAGDKGYITNVLNTMHLPIGALNEYQYSINKTNDFEKNSYVQHSLVKKCESKATIKELKKEKVLITFINKFENPYQFIPLRWAILDSVSIRNDRIYFTVVLGDYCYASDLLKFNQYLFEKFSDVLFLQQNDSNDTEWTNEHKGFLAFEKEELNKDLLCCDSDTSWKKTIAILSEIELFKKNNCIFSKVELFCKNEKSPLSISKNKKYKLINGKEYKLDLSYYFNHGNDKTSKIVLVCGDSVKCIDDSEKEIQLTQGILSYRIVASNRTDNECMSFKVENDNSDVLIAKRPIISSIKLGWYNWIFIAISLLIAGITMDSLSRNDAGEIEWKFSLVNSLIKAISAAAIWIGSFLYSRKN